MSREQFKELFDMYFDVIRNYIYYRSGDPDLATDVAQETFIRVWEKQIQPITGKEKALLYKISGDLFISSYRKQTTEMNFKLNLKPESTQGAPDEAIQFEELGKKYDAALQRLPEKQRVVFLMSRLDNMKYHEIADTLGLSVKAVEKRMKNALDYLRRVMKTDG